MMRPTNLGFKSPREVCQAPQYNPTVTAKGSKLLDASTSSKQLKQRPKSSLSSRFCDSQRGNNSIFLGPGRYNDEHYTIMHTVKSKITAKYKGEVIDARSGPYTYAGDAKVLDLAFLSPQTKKTIYPYVITTSINLMSPKMNSPTSVGPFSTQSTALLSATRQNKESSHNNNGSAQSQMCHNRTKSMMSEGTKAPWEKIINNLSQVPGDQVEKTSRDYNRKGSIELTKAQKQRNDQIYLQLIDSQLSNDLKALKKELEDYQKKKTTVKEVKEKRWDDARQNLSSTEGTFTLRATETDKDSIDHEREKADLYDKENGKHYIQIQEDVQAQEPLQEQELLLQPESRVLAETSSNQSNTKGADVSFDGDGFITMNLSSPKFNDSKPKQKEANNTSEKKSLNKAIELKRRAMVTLTSSSSVHSVSHHSRSGSMTSKAVRKL